MLLREATGRMRTPGMLAPSVRILPRLAALLVLLVVVAKVVPAAGLLVGAGLVIHALRGTRQAVEALIILAYLLLLGVAGLSQARWGILFAAFARVAFDHPEGVRSSVSRVSWPPFVGVLLAYVAVVLFMALVASQLPLVSIMKLTSFGVGVFTLTVGFYRTMSMKRYWASFIVTVGLVLIFASIPMYGMSMGFARNGAGFQGITSHPQTFGPVVMPGTVFLTGLVLFYGYRRTWIVGGALLGWFWIVASQSRTALLAVLLGLMLMVLLVYAFQPAWQARLTTVLTNWVALLLVFVALGFVVTQPAVIEREIESYFRKGDATASSTFEALQSSRSELIAFSMFNFWNNPLTGIGFGIPSDLDRFDATLETGFLGLPVKASVEKGFMPSAVLEETGVVGAVLVVAMIVSLLWPIVTAGNPMLLWVVLSCLLINMGEMVFFSLGGMGLFLWVIIAFCYGMAQHHLKTAAVPVSPRARWERPFQHANSRVSTA